METNHDGGSDATFSLHVHSFWSMTGDLRWWWLCADCPSKGMVAGSHVVLNSIHSIIFDTFAKAERLAAHIVVLESGV